MDKSVDAIESSNSSSISKLLKSKHLSSVLNSTAPTSVDDPNDDDGDNSMEFIALNNRIKTDFTSYCLSFLRDDDEARKGVEVMWNKYLQCVGDVPMLSAFFDILPFPVRSSILPKYHTEILNWFQTLFHIRCDTILYCSNTSESLLQIIRYVHKVNNQDNNISMKKAMIYVSNDFDVNLKQDLSSSLSNIQIEYCLNDSLCDDTINVNELEKILQRDSNHPEKLPMMVIAQAGTTTLGYCDELTKIKQICEKYKLWLHVTGDLIGSLAVLPTIKDTINLSCDSVTMDMVKLLGIQNLPCLTLFIRPVVNTPIASNENINTNITSNSTTRISTSSSVSSAESSTTTTDNNNNLDSFSEILLNSPSVGLLSIWSVSQRCSKEDTIYHMQYSFDLINLYLKELKQIKTIRIVNDVDRNEKTNYRRISSDYASDDSMPKIVAIFRFETENIPNLSQMENVSGYTDLLNLWLFDKLFPRYSNMNLELVKNVQYQCRSSNNSQSNPMEAHAIRFAPLEHLLDIIDQSDLESFFNNLQNYCDILSVTMSARARFASTVAKYKNLISIPMSNWAGIGAVRYESTPTHSTETTEENKTKTYDMNTIQAELARKLQANDSAFSLGSNTDEHGSMFYIRLGMIRKHDDLDILLEKISNAGMETETSFKYVQDMAEKIIKGIEKVQQDLKTENEQILAQEGLLRQLPLISNIMSWWSPSPSASPLATKGRSFDLNSGQVESTEDIYAYRMQIRRQSPYAPTHNDGENNMNRTSTNSSQIPPEENNNK